jgi:hypothetical protein
MHSNRVRAFVFVVLPAVILVGILVGVLNGQTAPSATPVTDHADISNFSLVGTENGLYRLIGSNSAAPLWTNGNVRRIVQVPYGWFILSSKGILFSADLVQFEYRNSNLITKTVKYYRSNGKSFGVEIQDLKDLECDPASPSNIVTCSRDSVYISTNAGTTWIDFSSPGIAPGSKSVAVYTDPDIHILTGHPFSGLYQRNFTRKSGWEKWTKGIMLYSDFAEEISDIHVEATSNGPAVYAANNFFPNVYQLDISTKTWKKLWGQKDTFNMVESLYVRDGALCFLTRDGILEIPLSNAGETRITTNDKKSETNFVNEPRIVGNVKELVKRLEASTGSRAECLLNVKNGNVEYRLTDLWMYSEPSTNSYMKAALHKQGLYLPTSVANSKSQMERTFLIMSNAGLNMITIDMKDDWGYLRFKPDTPLLRQMGQTVGAINISNFIASMKARGYYSVARIVVFKDKALYHYNGGEFAIQDSSTGKPWRGSVTGTNGKVSLTEEYWVDPYSEKVWEYNVAIAKELIAKGFDEIQFDYIRFPTDADNLENMNCRYRDKGMDKESALMSYLNYARENISAPISIDIYGANGWYRTGARTGQDVEILRNYVNAICPMYYPSHFPSDFLFTQPYDKRTYRIYYFGTLRNHYIARGNVAVRPWVQAFNLYTKYDREYYGTNYILNQVAGVKESVDSGYTFWNAGNFYGILLQTYPNRPSAPPAP